MAFKSAGFTDTQAMELVKSQFSFAVINGQINYQYEKRSRNAVQEVLRKRAKAAVMQEKEKENEA